MIEDARPSVVRIHTSKGYGSGVIFEVHGDTALVLTNHHVIDGTLSPVVEVDDFSTYIADVVGTDTTRDLAVLRICCGDFSSLSFGNVSQIKPGHEIVAMGYPLGLEGEATVTRGIISAIRYVEERRSLIIQTDAAVNPGNSGGPVLSPRGEILGISSFAVRETRSGTNLEGLGFAVAASTILEQLPFLKSDSTQSPVPIASSGSVAVDLFILSSQSESISLDLSIGDNIHVSYNTEGAGGSSGEVEFVIVGPNEEPLITVDQIQSNAVTFEAELAGTYNLVFSNPYLLRGLVVTVNYSISLATTATGPSPNANPQGTRDFDGERSEARGLFLSLISIIPDTRYNRYGVAINDYVRIQEIADVAPPDDNASDDTLLAYYDSIANVYGFGVGSGPWISGFGQYSQQFLENREHLAYSFLNIDQSATTIVSPNVFEVVRGRFDPHATASALARCNECPSPDLMEHRGVEFLSWTDWYPGSLHDRFTPPIFDVLGLGGQLAMSQSYAFRTIESVDMRLLLDAQQDLAPSLGDNADFALAAKEMDDLRIYSGGLILDADNSSHVMVYTPSSEDTAEEEWICILSTMEIDKCIETVKEHHEKGMILEEYETVGIGNGQDGRGYFMAIVLVHSSESQSFTNEEVFRQIWQGGVNFRTGELWKDIYPNEPYIESHGKVLTVLLHSSSSPGWWDLLYSKNSLLWRR